MTSRAIGVLHPGEMGVTVGASARAGGGRVLWASEGRSAQTRERADAAGLEDARTLASVCAASDVIFSVCPPSSALDLARNVAAQRFSGFYVDGNAVSPGTAREIGRIVEGAGATFVDGGIIGPPPRARGTTRLYLSGAEAGRIARLFTQGPLEAIAIDGEPGSASALTSEASTGVVAVEISTTLVSVYETSMSSRAVSNVPIRGCATSTSNFVPIAGR